jgi:hypothetical protein
MFDMVPLDCLSSHQYNIVRFFSVSASIALIAKHRRQLFVYWENIDQTISPATGDS